jgi:hypothetical protein
MVAPLTKSLQKQQDLQLLRDGAPALLLLTEGLIDADPENPKLLIAGIKAFASYANILQEDGEEERAAALSNKAGEYGLRLLSQLPRMKNISNISAKEIPPVLSRIKKKHLPSLFWGAYGWASWVRHQNGSPASLAALPVIELLMQRVIELDETFYYGGAHIFLGALYGSRPPMYGGKPEISRDHFERALMIGRRSFFVAHIAYADSYARMTFNRELYESLLQEVINGSNDDPQIISANQLAKKTARRLLSRIDEIF